jgi:hypothetical protein
MSVLKRVSMAGSEVVLTDARLADVVLEYAKHLGRAGATDTVAIPVARNGRPEEADLLLGPASQIALTENDDDSLDAIALPEVDRVMQDLRDRLDRLTGRGSYAAEESTFGTSFTDFDAY